MSDKPAYRIPTMKEIARVKRNGFKVVSTFSGCGGSCLGFEMRGFEILWASEFIEAARGTYRANHPKVKVDDRDIRLVKPEEILAAIRMKPREIDVLEGSPPCASFSTAGKRSAGWGQVKQYSDTKQRTDDLFFEFARILKGVQPKVFVAENVSGLVKGVAKGYFLEILQVLKDAGYNVRCKVLDAQWLGVPQMRQRTIFIGVRRDLAIEPIFPKPFAYQYSVRDAIPWITKVEQIGPQFTPQFISSKRPSPTISSLGNFSFKESPYARAEAETDISNYAIGREWDLLKEGESTFYGGPLTRASRRRPCPTITQTGGTLGASSVVHPTEKRKFTIRELKRICAFPDDFVLTGTYSQQWERLGRAVPPLMMRAVAESVEEILEKAKAKR